MLVKMRILVLLLLGIVISHATSYDLPATIGGNLAPNFDTINIKTSTSISKGARLTLNGRKVVRVWKNVTLTVYGALVVRGANPSQS